MYCMKLIVEKIMINDTIFQYRIVKLCMKLLVKKVFCIHFLNPSSCFDFKKNGFGKWIFRSQVICMNVYHQMILCAYFIYCNPLFLHYSFFMGIIPSLPASFAPKIYLYACAGVHYYTIRILLHNVEQKLLFHSQEENSERCRER